LRCSRFKKCASSDGDQNGFVVPAHVRRFHMSRTAFEVIPNSLANRFARRSRFVQSCLAELKMRTASFDEIVHIPLPCDILPGEGVLAAENASLSISSSWANDAQLCSSTHRVANPRWSCMLRCCPSTDSQDFTRIRWNPGILEVFAFSTRPGVVIIDCPPSCQVKKQHDHLFLTTTDMKCTIFNENFVMSLHHRA
jgi:hypothetical protein